jgi:flagellar FliL protein
MAGLRRHRGKECRRAGFAGSRPGIFIRHFYCFGQLHFWGKIMAEKDKLDLGEEKKPAPVKKTLFIVIGAILALLIATFATLYFTGIFPAKSDGGKGAHKSSESSKEKKGKKSKSHDSEALPTAYETLEPAFTVSFKNNPEARLLQVGISVASTEKTVLDAVKKHTPMIRNNILLLLAAQDPAALKTAEGKEALRAKIQEEINAIVKKQTGEADGIEGIFFTGFVMQ